MPAEKLEEGDFCVRIASCGTFNCRVDYERTKDKDALKLIKRVSKWIAADFVGEKNLPLFMYHFACLLLNELEYKKENLNKNIENAKNELGKWRLEFKSKETKAN